MIQVATDTLLSPTTIHFCIKDLSVSKMALKAGSNVGGQKRRFLILARTRSARNDSR